jgi:hypothetical protein
MKLKRYEIHQYGISPCHEGSWVKASDIMELEADNDTLIAELKLVRGQLNDRVILENRGLMNAFGGGK